MNCRMHGASRCFVTILGCGILVLIAARGNAQQEPAPPSGLSLEQQRLASRFERLEAVAARLAELAQSSEPERAEQLRRTIKASREKGINERFQSIVELLESERLSAAARDQTQLQAELEQLLQVLLEDPGDNQRDAMKRFLKTQIRELGKLIRQQRSLRNQNEQGSDTDGLAKKQSDVSDQAGNVQRALEQEDSDPSSVSESAEGGKNSDDPSEKSKSPEGQPNQGQSPEGQPQDGPSQPGQPQPGQPQPSQQGQPAEPGESQESSDPLQRAAERVAQARRAMQQAEQKLRDAERREAEQEQREAQRELEAARAELERILRQIREEEMEKLLAKLAARFRDMLAAQQSIYDDTTDIFKQATESASRNLMLQAIRLSRRESELVRDAEKALTLLREDGTSIAFPETTEQIADDMRSVTTRLAATDTGPITQTVELDIIAALEDMIESLDQARDELAQKPDASPPGGGGGSPGESPLVSKIAELRMIRTLQARVYKRTQDLGSLADNPLVKRAELEVEMAKLAGRQERIFQATRDLDTDQNR